MVTVLRWVLLAVIALLLVNLVVLGIGTSDTGPVEKLVLVGVGLLLLLAAWRVHHLGAHRPHRT
jgi:peptidoglycan/LPS O-acetylase OafA/YrhL